MTSVSSNLVLISEPSAHVAEIVLNRSEALNAMSVAMAEAIEEAVVAAVALNPSVLVVSSACDKAFSVGADLKERARMTAQDLLDCRPQFLAAYRSLLDVAVPVVVALHGFAMGGGLELALTADLIVADETAVMGLPEVKIGLIPGGGGTQLLTRRVGPATAADLIFTGRRVNADEAYRLGVVDRLVPAGTAADQARDIAGVIALASPHSLTLAKEAMRGGAALPVADALTWEDGLWRRAATSDDRVEGITAFVEKRPPQWPSHRV